MHRPEPQTRRAYSRQEPGSFRGPGSSRDPWLAQRQAYHDAANWLTVLLGHVEALRDARPEERPRHLELARRAARAAHRLCSLPPGSTAVSGRIDLSGHVRRLADHVRPEAAARDVSVEVDQEQVEEVLADPAGFDDALLNLMRNALEATPAGTTIRVRVRAEGPVAWIEVEDEGPGFAAGAGTKPGVDRGHGLARVRRWLETSGTSLRMGEAPGGGARVGFCLPVAGAPVEESSSGGLRILLVEDDTAVAEVLALLLRSDGHRVEHCLDRETAQRRLKGAAFDLLLCDQHLPDGDGARLLAELAGTGPALPGFLVTGDPESVHCDLPGVAGVLAKPVSRDQLRTAVSVVTRGAPSADPPDDPEA